MRQVVVYVFYLWLALSFLYLLVQVVRKLTSGSAVAKPAVAKPADVDPVAVPLVEPPDGIDPVARLLAEEAALGSEQTGPTQPEPAPSSHGPSEEPRPMETVPSSAARPREELGSPERSEPDTLRVPAEPVANGTADLDAVPAAAVDLGASAPNTAQPMAAVAPEAAPEPAGSRPRPSLSALLAGIRLPHDLMPVVPDRSPIDDAHVSLLTSSAPAAIVGPAVADELERLGYALEPKNDDELIARRGDDELVLGIETSPALLSDGGRPRYPSAAEGDVLITIDAVS